MGAPKRRGNVRRGHEVDYCGCCGREIVYGKEHNHWQWCVDCLPHIDPNPRLPPHEKTYFARNGQECPYQVKAYNPE